MAYSLGQDRSKDVHIGMTKTRKGAWTEHID
jgi:hypothetical protein